jgi:hypothetical protein
VKRFAIRTLVAVAVLVATPAAASAAYGWTTSAASFGKATAGAVPAGPTPTATAAGRDVTVAWAAVTMPGSTATADRYTVARYDEAGVAQTVQSSCAGALAALTCTETGVPSGTWTYTVTPSYRSWEGTEGPASAPVALSGPSLTLSPASMAATGANPVTTATVENFKKNEVVTFRRGSATGTSLGTVTVPSSGGPASRSITITSAAGVGSYQVFAVGSMGTTTSATFTVTANTVFAVTTSATPRAGVPFTVRVQAMTNGSNDGSYRNDETLTFSGPSPSPAPSSTAPTYPSSPVDFNNQGRADVSITLYRAETVTLTVSEGSRTGSITLTVQPNLALSFSACPDPDENTNSTITVSRPVADTWGNADPSEVAVSLSASAAFGGGTWTPSTVTIPAGGTTSPAAVYRTPNTLFGKTVTVTAAATGYTSASCVFFVS